MILILYYGVPSAFGWCVTRWEGGGWDPAACLGREVVGVGVVVEFAFVCVCVWCGGWELR